MGEHNDIPPRENPDVAHEHSDVNVRAILVFGVALALAAVVIHVGLYWLLQSYENRATEATLPLRTIESGEQIPPPPRLRVSPRADLAEMRAAEDKELQTYGWVDKEKSIVRLPIDRAMELIAERGLPTRKQAEEPPPSSLRQAQGSLSAASRGRKEEGID
jgi:hypothetical protein